MIILMPDLPFCQILAQFYEPVYTPTPNTHIPNAVTSGQPCFYWGVFKEFFFGLMIDPLQRHTFDTAMLRGYTDAYNKSYGFNAHSLQTRVPNKNRKV